MSHLHIPLSLSQKFVVYEVGVGMHRKVFGGMDISKSFDLVRHEDARTYEERHPLRVITLYLDTTMTCHISRPMFT